MPTFYRLVKSNPPTEIDFMSYLALGRPVPRNATPAVRRSWEGVSVRSTLMAMGPLYELWDLESGNRLAEYATEAEALAFVRGALEDVPRDQLLSWALARWEGEGKLENVAEGEALIDLALGVSA